MESLCLFRNVENVVLLLLEIVQKLNNENRGARRNNWLKFGQIYENPIENKATMA